LVDDRRQMKVALRTGSLPPLLLLLLLLLSVSLSACSDIIEYYVLEELSPGRVVGDLVNDFGFAERLDPATVESLRFSVLKQPAYDRRFFAFNETSGLIVTTRRIDRELICRGQDECIIKFDVAVKPMRYFQIIKVRNLRYAPLPMNYYCCVLVLSVVLAGLRFYS